MAALKENLEGEQAAKIEEREAIDALRRKIKAAKEANAQIQEALTAAEEATGGKAGELDELK